VGGEGDGAKARVVLSARVAVRCGARARRGSRGSSGGGARLGDEAAQLLPECGRLEARHLALQLSQRRTQRALAAVRAC